MAASGEITGGYWEALLIGGVLLLTFVVTTAAVVMRVYRARHTETALQPTGELLDLLPSGMGGSLWRCQALIAEAVIVRQRLSGEIDAKAYQSRMHELARQAISIGRAQRNA